MLIFVPFSPDRDSRGSFLSTSSNDCLPVFVAELLMLPLFCREIFAPVPRVVFFFFFLSVQFVELVVGKFN